MNNRIRDHETVYRNGDDLIFFNFCPTAVSSHNQSTVGIPRLAFWMSDSKWDRPSPRLWDFGRLHHKNCAYDLICSTSWFSILSNDMTSYTRSFLCFPVKNTFGRNPCCLNLQRTCHFPVPGMKGSCLEAKICSELSLDVPIVICANQKWVW